MDTPDPLVGQTPSREPLEVALDQPGPMALVFLTAGCAECRDIWPLLPALGGQVRVLAITPSAGLEVRRSVQAVAPPGTEVLMSSPAWERFGITVAPQVVLIDPPGPPSEPLRWHSAVSRLGLPDLLARGRDISPRTGGAQAAVSRERPRWSRLRAVLGARR